MTADIRRPMHGAGGSESCSCLGLHRKWHTGHAAKSAGVPVVTDVGALSVQCTPTRRSTRPMSCTPPRSAAHARPPTGKVTWTESGSGYLPSAGCELVNGRCTIVYRPPAGT